MSKEEEIFYKIEQYLHQELDVEQKALFEQAIGQDSALQQKVRAHQLADDLIIENKLTDIQALLAVEKVNRDRRQRYTRIGIGAVVCLLLIAVLTWYLSRKQEKPANETKTISVSSAAPIVQPVPETAEPKSIVPALPEQSLKNRADGKPPKETVKIPALAFVEKNTTTADTISVQPKIVEQPQTVTHPELVLAPAADPCSSVSLSFDQHVAAPCKGMNNGTLIVRHLKGGKAPYNVKLFNSTQEEMALDQLAKGKYTLVVTDKNHCGKTVSDLVVAEKDCPVDYSFNPFLGEQWSIPNTAKSGKLEIHDPSGKIYFQKEITADTPFAWNGQSLEGELKTGYFMFIIYYIDGTQDHGTVTIVR